MQWLCRCLIFFSLISSRKVFGGWIDEDTPEDKRTTVSLVDKTEYHLVMSDEFNVEGRTFADGDDPKWTGLDKSDDDSAAAGGGSLHFYNSSAITTTDDGMLEILTTLSQTEWKHYDPIKKEYRDVTKYFKTGMLQSWNKFCFTGGIVEVDVVFPGDPDIGGLWPAVWLLGNLGRATYEASTNNIWPWSYDTCDRDSQEAQTISRCNLLNHYGLHPSQGRGATEIDIVEVMAGYDDKALPSTVPPVQFPYADLTLQVAPGIIGNRPHSGYQPRRKDSFINNGHTELLAQSWYNDLHRGGNTTFNPFFYGTYLGETKPEEPVSRNKNQAFQADAIGAMHQLTSAHFETPHTIRLEWQPGRGGRLDWFVKDHKIEVDGKVEDMEGDGLGQQWLHAFGIKDESLKNATGAQIPIEPSHLIINTGVSSTWGFPSSLPEGCTGCYDCSNATCACAFNPGFCNMMKKTKVAMYIDSVRVYQSKDDSSHVGAPHTVGCDVAEFPTQEYIRGHSYRYMRPLPFGVSDKGPLETKIKRGGAFCNKNSDCGGNDTIGDLTSDLGSSPGKGYCKKSTGNMLGGLKTESKCECYEGYTGPRCLVGQSCDDSAGAWESRGGTRIFKNIATPALPTSLVSSLFVLLAITLYTGAWTAIKNRSFRQDI